MRQPLAIPALTAAAVEAVDTLYRTTRDVRLRTRAQLVLLAGEQRRAAPAIARIVRAHEETVRRWLKRGLAEELAGLKDRPLPRSLGQPDSLWTLQRLADYLAALTGIRLSYETVRMALKAGEIVLSRPPHTVSSSDPAYQGKKRRSRRPATV